MTEAEKILEDLQSAYIADIMSRIKGYEREFLIEVVRSLDYIAFAFDMAPNAMQLRRKDLARRIMLLGSSVALGPLIERVQETSGGIPWGPTDPASEKRADDFLFMCGQLANFRRVAALERSGVVRSEVSPGCIKFYVHSDAQESEEWEVATWLRAEKLEGRSESISEVVKQKNRRVRRIDKYTDTAMGWFIRYDPELREFDYYVEMAELSATGVVEAEAVPPDSMIGGMKFKDWVNTANIACSRVMHHVACATRLTATRPGLNLRNLLTIYCRREDLLDVWKERGIGEDDARKIIAAFTLDATSAAVAASSFEIPLPYYIDFGRDFVLFPAFGALLNPYAGMLPHLRTQYKKNWFKAVNDREASQRDDLKAMFPEPRFTVPSNGFKLRRPNGSEITDVDTVVLDKHTGTLLLIQLKWFDIYGRSPNERRNRISAVAEANEWVDKVSEWVAGRSANEIAKWFNLGFAGKEPPSIMVLTRYIARFDGGTQFDPRAYWVNWPTLVKVRQSSPQGGLPGILVVLRRNKTTTEPKPIPRGVYQFLGLTIEMLPW